MIRAFGGALDAEVSKPAMRWSPRAPAEEQSFREHYWDEENVLHLFDIQVCCFRLATYTFVVLVCSMYCFRQHYIIVLF